LDNFAVVLEQNDADKTTASGLRDLCAIFFGNEKKPAATFLKSIELQTATGDMSGGQRIGMIVAPIDGLRNLIKDVAKNDVIKILDSLLDMLRNRADVPIRAFVAGVLAASAPKLKAAAKAKSNKKGAALVDNHLVDDYVKRLEAALGDDAKFEPLLQELQSDERVAQAEAVEIASRFYGRTAKSTSRPKALERVRERHAKLMKFKRQPSTAGRSAA
jgi:hypothetical protein